MDNGQLSEIELHELRELLPKVKELVETEEKASWARAVIRQYLWRATIALGTLLAALQIWDIISKRAAP